MKATGKSEFQLLGHDCPYAQYPAPVIPIGRLDGKRVAIYPGRGSGPVAEPIGGNCKFVRHSTELKRRLQDFNYREDRLFGFAEDDVQSYNARVEPVFLEGVLSRLTPAKAKALLSKIRSAIGRPADRPCESI